ncbi:CBASS system CD-NTase-associated NAD(+) hydrolase Cap12 [Flavobacterium daejeonense]|uniref:CD-NTase-associated protein 12 n=1 Tax=Flavobacterium daejeonense TaxID=350893 RepID=CAP12_FLADA|nr:STING domain-containing protein [Flavobacterium daejeonense]P0DUD9.1 RecName: Full=CD-NTase-associated protein 12; Short=Cap12; AltName: Full=NAD(+) hydrolase; AltName: Full=TIR-STING; Short=FdSTING [Flavobacterium daejeonense]
MKTRIFIGSSKEGLEIAEYIKLQLGTKYECYLWTDDIFKFNESFLYTLLKEASLFDFGILVATKDDLSTIRDKSFDTPRDNVIFEFGLFLGRLGPSRAFVIQESGAKLPTDLLGITVPQFEKTIPLANSTSLNNEIERISKTIDEKITLGELGLLPSTVLAIGYFYNFVSIVCESIHTKSDIKVDDAIFKKFELNIVIPKDLDADIKKRATVYFKSKTLKEIQFETSSRNFPVFVTYDNQSKDVLKLYDMPTTLGGIDKAIEMFMRKGHIGKTSQQKLLEERELRNFQTTLQNLIDNDAFCRNIVKIIQEE